MRDVYYTQENYWKIGCGNVYEWEVVYSKNFRRGYDGVFHVSGKIDDFVNNFVMFLGEHLKDETAIVSLYNEQGSREVEAVITRGVVVYINGLGEWMKE